MLASNASPELVSPSSSGRSSGFIGSPMSERKAFSAAASRAAVAASMVFVAVTVIAVVSVAADFVGTAVVTVTKVCTGAFLASSASAWSALAFSRGSRSNLWPFRFLERFFS